MDDRISQLPEPILHQILSLLPQKHAIKTCLLSQSWRYIGPTRPKIEFRESSFRGRGRNDEIEFVSVVEKTLQRYVDQNLSIQELILETRLGNDALLNKWIPIVLLNMGVKTFNLDACNFSLPSVVFEAELLEELVLKGCKLDQINNNCKKLRMLKRLSLEFVDIKNETFKKIMSSCPSIEHLVLSRSSCNEWLRNFKVSNARNLKHLDCSFFISIEIDDDAPSLETIRLKHCHYWYHENYFFPCLKSLHLFWVHLPKNLWSDNNFPCLEELEIHHCSGFNEFTLSNRSIKRLKALYLEGCILDQIFENCINVKLQALKRLSLHPINIKEETFEKIMSSCPSIQHLVLGSCCALSSVKVNKARNLKHFDCLTNGEKGKISIEINDDAPSLETIRIDGGCHLIWYHHKNYFFPRLKSLNLQQVHLTTESFDNLSSNNCPCLEDLELRHCSGFTEFKLSNRSIKRLIIKTSNHPIKAACFDVANILYFEFTSENYDLPSISFATTSRVWKSRLHLWNSLDLNPNLYEFLKAISQSQISLDIHCPPLMNQGTYGCEPVVVEHLRILADYRSSSAYLALFNSLFRICRPRYIQLVSSYADSQKICENQLAESVLKTLARQRDLEKFNIRVKLLLLFFAFCFLFYAARSFFRRD